MEKYMICFRCKKEIEDNDNYFQILEWNKKKMVKEEFVHKTCWNEFLKQVGNVEESMSIIRGLKSWFVRQGVLPKEEYSIC